MSGVWQLLFICSLTWSLFNSRCPRVYMDEIFHVEQTQRFCRGDLSYHPLITTPPGPYLIPAAVSHFTRFSLDLFGYDHTHIDEHAMVEGPPQFERAEHREEEDSSSMNDNEEDDLSEEYYEFEYDSVLESMLLSPVLRCSVGFCRASNLIFLPALILILWALSRQWNGQELLRCVEKDVHSRQLFDSSKWKRLCTQWKTQLQRVHLERAIDYVIQRRVVDTMLHPFLFFFLFLFYTDIPSLTITMLSVLLITLDPQSSRHPGWPMTLLFAVLSLLHRQTNIVWIFFASVLRVNTLFQYHHFCCPNPSNDNDNNNNDNTQTTDPLFNDVLIWSVRNITVIISELWPSVVIASLFLSWVIFVNEGRIAIGDPSHHSLSLHLSQIVYLCPALAMSIIGDLMHRVNLAHLKSLLMSKHGICSCLVTLFIFEICMHSHFRKAHPFLISDNRHYTFYLWRYLLKHDWFVYFILAPFSSLCAVILWHLARLRGLSQWTLSWFALSAALPLCLSPLIEIRYFLPPCVIWRILFAHHKPDQLTNPLAFDDCVRAWNSAMRVQWHILAKKPYPPISIWFSEELPKLVSSYQGFVSVVNTLVFVITDLVIVYVFLFRPFTWPDGTVARFMW